MGIILKKQKDGQQCGPSGCCGKLWRKRTLKEAAQDQLSSAKQWLEDQCQQR